jgi:hypothetical protein
LITKVNQTSPRAKPEGEGEGDLLATEWAVMIITHFERASTINKMQWNDMHVGVDFCKF